MKHYLLLLIIASAVCSATVSAQESYIPLVREGAEWGYAEYLNENSACNGLSYYRLQFMGTTEIDGVTYHNLYRYSTFMLSGWSSRGSKLVAYMREMPDGKVYARYPADNNPLSQLFGDAAELGDVLVYDFGIKPGEIFTLTSGVPGAPKISAKCTETGTVKTADGERRYVKFGQGFAYDTLIEGIGPVGDCDIASPLKADRSSGAECGFSVSLLYERSKPLSSEPTWLNDGYISYKTSDFDWIAVHDGSEWLWSKGVPSDFTLPDFSKLNGTKPDIEAASYTPLVREGVEWAYSEDLWDNPWGYIVFYRLQFRGTEDIDGETYYKLYRYSTFWLNEQNADESTLVAYMRETPDHKVYARYPDNNNPLEVKGEVLLYDFAIDKGEAEVFYPAGDMYYAEKRQCIESGTIDVTDGERRYMRFERNIPYDYVIEGIGPFGDCDLSMPYRSYTTCLPDCDPNITFLYERTVPQSNQMYQGNIVYKSQNFGYSGVHDPSVWLWPETTKPQYEASISVEPAAIEFTVEGGVPTVRCADEPIATVRVYGIDGQLLRSVSPNSHTYSIPADMRYGIMTVVEVTTATHHATCKMLY